MRKAISIILVLAICFSLAACDKSETVLDDASANMQAEVSKSEQPMATPTPRVFESDQPKTTQTPEAFESVQPIASATQNENLSSYNFANASEVYTDPDAFKGKEYSSPFMIISDMQQVEGDSMYYANGYINGSQVQTYTVLVFKGDSVPELAINDTVYARGIIEGKGFIYDDDDNAVDLLWLSVTDIELDAGYEDFPSESKEYTFEEEEFIATNNSLSIEIYSLSFSQDGLGLFTKTSDTSVKLFTTYYFDIIIHQDGFFAWYHDCNFWINPNSTGYDHIPFPLLDSAKDMTVEFVPYSEDGKLLYEPLVIEVTLSDE